MFTFKMIMLTRGGHQLETQNRIIFFNRFFELF